MKDSFFKLISYVFHPLFLPLYFVILSFYFPHYPMVFITSTQKLMIVSIVTISSVLLPASVILLLFYLSKINSVYLKQKSERYLPYVIVSLIYLILTYQFLNISIIPNVYAMIFFVGAINIIFLLIFLRYILLSAHVISISSFIVLFYFITKFLHTSFIYYFLVLIFILGLIISSRLYLKAHTKTEIISALFLGIIVNAFAYFISFKYGFFIS